MATATPAYTGPLHAGAGTTLLLVQAAAIIPGLLPCLVLVGALAVLALVPLLAVTLVAAVFALPVLGLRTLLRGR
jgi:hypothetical protein